MVSTYSDYAYYTGTYGGALTEAEYNSYVPKAHDEIKYQTFDASETAPESMTDNVKSCECALVDAMHRFAQAPTGVSRVDNDGYSISYEQGRSTEATYESICKRYLAWPENLMFRGA